MTEQRRRIVKGFVHLGTCFTVVGMILMFAAYGVAAGLLAAFIAVGISLWSIGLCALTIAERAEREQERHGG